MLAGHSFGGLYVLTFAARYPDEVAGMVLVDSTAPASAAKPGAASPDDGGSYDVLGRVSALVSVSARLGLGRLYAQLAYGGLPPRSRDEVRATGATASNLRSTIDEYVQANASTQEAASLRDFADKPLVVLTAGVGSDATHLAAQNHLATLSTNSVHRVIDRRHPRSADRRRSRRRRHHASDPRRRLIGPHPPTTAVLVSPPDLGARRAQRSPAYGPGGAGRQVGAARGYPVDDGSLMAKPVLMAVLEQTRERNVLQRELAGRYGADYEIICTASAASALERLDVLRVSADAEVLAVCAADEMTGMTGIQFLQRAHQWHPHAQRVLLIPWGNRSASKPILKAIALGRIDRYATVPSRADQSLHTTRW